MRLAVEGRFGGGNLPGILFSGTGKIFRLQYWNIEYSKIERLALRYGALIWWPIFGKCMRFCNSSEFEFGDLAQEAD